MRLGGRLAAAIEILDDMTRRHRPAADALKDWGLSHRFAGSADRAAIGNIVYDALRRRRSASWLLQDEGSRAQAFGALLLHGHSPASLAQALDGDRFAPAPLSDAERAAFAARDLAAAPAVVRGDLPDWCAPLFEAAFGMDWADEAAALSDRPPLDLRVNTLKADRAAVLAELSEAHPAEAPFLPEAIRIAAIQGDGRHPNVQAEPAFRKGWFEVQDLGSQMVARLAGAASGTQVLDYCAGAGGKTLSMSAAMQNTGQIYAYDSEKVRLAPIFDRLERAGCRNVQVVSRATELDPLAGHCDLVLVDAPCTGSGTWRRRPDAKWRLSDRQLAARQAEQSAILDKAARFVKPGGRLAYVTCSVFDGENGDQIAAFLARATGFAPVDHHALWRDGFGTETQAVRIDRDAGIRLTPLRTGTDGFYLAVLRRS
ncbi:MAG: RsmB/NOP family class I SAM-dependent RNA methyltransferase [Rhizobiaceae bacterium]|nr:RsmB/NOP family class I SAM-dependent RNA methyltransferase [Rhizobiaceae bacterium]